MHSFPKGAIVLPLLWFFPVIVALALYVVIMLGYQYVVAWYYGFDVLSQQDLSCLYDTPE